MHGILGKKVGMTNIYDASGRITPVTVVEAGPCHILQVKTKETDGYEAIQVGFGTKREKLITKAEAGHFKKSGAAGIRYVREIRVTNIANYKTGQKIDASIFAKGDYVDVVGVSIGRGFQGGVRRWNWAGGGAGHGSMFHRAVGSIQSGARLGRVTKGHHLPGHMGVENITIQNLEVIDVEPEKNLLVIKGSVPGHRNSLILIKEAKKRPKGFVRAKVVSTAPKKSVKSQVAKKK